MYQPKFIITPKILNAISEIATIKAIVDRSKVLPLNEAQLRRQAIIRMAHTSTSIEGNRLAEFQVDKVLSGMSVNADERSIKEVKNYQAALLEMEKIVGTKHVLSLEQILDLHRTLMRGLLEGAKTGHFRPGQIYIVDDLGDGRENLRFEGPRAGKVPFLMMELVKWALQSKKDGLHPIIIAGIFHLQFVSVHPFSDGNGRMSRLLTTLLLYQADWDFRKILVLDDYYNKDRAQYYNALNTVQGKSYQEKQDLTSWLEYFVEGFLIEARKVSERIAQIGFDKVASLDETVFLDSDEIRIIDFLTTTGRVTSSDVVEILGIAKRTAQLKIKNLVDKKLLKPKGAGPSIAYFLAQ